MLITNCAPPVISRRDDNRSCLRLRRSIDDIMVIENGNELVRCLVGKQNIRLTGESTPSTNSDQGALQSATYSALSERKLFHHDWCAEQKTLELGLSLLRLSQNYPTRFFILKIELKLNSL